MKQLIMKARSGVTLVELLVVILIVTILSVSMLPLLQPFVVESQYAAEAIPVIGNLRTKIGVYQYDKGRLPGIGTNVVETWIATTTQGGTAKASTLTADYYCPAKDTLPTTADGLKITGGLTVGTDDRNAHLGTACDIDYQDLKGKRSKPLHYQYVVVLNGTDYAYFVGCFGDGNGLKAGTGYAVCEIVKGGHKYVGTWKRYKPVTDASKGDYQVCFSSYVDPTKDGNKQLGCYVPIQSEFTKAVNGQDDSSGRLKVVSDMEGYGWEF